MGGKAKPTKHTAAETARKNQLATGNMGGGSAGRLDRQGGKAGHARFICKICMQQAPDMKSMKQHYDSRHPAVEFKEEDFEDMHAKYGGSTQGVAVHGSLKKSKSKEKN